MRLSSKARSLLTRAYITNRPIAVVQEDIERELIDSRLMKYTERPLMVISHDGKQFCRKRAENRDNG